MARRYLFAVIFMTTVVRRRRCLGLINCWLSLKIGLGPRWCSGRRRRSPRTMAHVSTSGLPIGLSTSGLPLAPEISRAMALFRAFHAGKDMVTLSGNPLAASNLVVWALMTAAAPVMTLISGPDYYSSACYCYCRYCGSAATTGNWMRHRLSTRQPKVLMKATLEFS